MNLPTVAELLPHKPPMVLLDELLSFAEGTATCRVTLRPTSMFVEKGSFRAVVAVEYMAQCVGVCTSMRLLARSEPVTAGYLVGARELWFAVDHFEVGDELLVESTITYDGRDMGSFECTVTREGLPVASGILNVFRQNPQEV